MESWQRIFANTLSMRFTLTEVGVEIAGDIAWVVLTEQLETQHREGTAAATVQATNIFERHQGQWFLVHHHGSPVHAPSGGGPAQMH
jgi:ketosteroid isomerase-like protein